MKKQRKKTKKLIIIESCWDSLGVVHKILNKIIKECNEKKIKEQQNLISLIPMTECALIPLLKHWQN